MKANLGSEKRKAYQLLSNPKKLLALLQYGLHRIQENKHKLREVISDLKGIFRLLNAWVKGEYLHVPWKTLVSSLTAVLYFLNPIDFIPDFLLVGFVDDIAVIGWVLHSIRKDLDHFLEWEKNNIVIS